MKKIRRLVKKIRKSVAENFSLLGLKCDEEALDIKLFAIHVECICKSLLKFSAKS